jgi:uncharacterized membrane-anchored protein
MKLGRMMLGMGLLALAGRSIPAAAADDQAAAVSGSASAVTASGAEAAVPAGNAPALAAAAGLSSPANASAPAAGVEQASPSPSAGTMGASSALAAAASPSAAAAGAAATAQTPPAQSADSAAAASTLSAPASALTQTKTADALGGTPAAVAVSQAANAVSAPPQTLVWTAVDGPAHLTLSSEVLLDLPAGWRFVPKDQLQAYFSPGGRTAGDWDLGVALGPGNGTPELRLQFEPMGAVDDRAGLEEPIALLARVQQMADADNAQRRRDGRPESQIKVWNQPPAYELAVHRLLFGETRSENGQDFAAWRLRLPGRAGVLKLDLLAPADALAALSSQAAVLAAGLSFQADRGLDARQASDKAAPLDLNGLVLDGVFGHPGYGGPSKSSSPVWLWMILSALMAVALGVGAVLIWRRFQAKGGPQPPAGGGSAPDGDAGAAEKGASAGAGTAGEGAPAAPDSGAPEGPGAAKPAGETEGNRSGNDAPPEGDSDGSKDAQ